MKKAISTNAIVEHIENARTFYNTVYSNDEDVTLRDRKLRIAMLVQGIVSEIAIANIRGENYTDDDICNVLRTLGIEIIDSNTGKELENDGKTGI